MLVHPTSTETKPLKIVLITDSLAMPRELEFGNIPFECTYPFILEMSTRKFWGTHAPLLIERKLRGRIISTVLRDWHEDIELARPDILILHVGICDCSPRVFTLWEHGLVNRLRPVFLRLRFLNWIHKHRSALIRLRPNNVYVSANEFSRIAKEIVDRAKLIGIKAVAFINIIVPDDKLELRSPGAQHNADVYNQILKDRSDGILTFVIDLNELVVKNGGCGAFTCDSHHLNQAGHQLISGELIKFISRFYPPGSLSNPATSGMSR